MTTRRRRAPAALEYAERWWPTSRAEERLKDMDALGLAGWEAYAAAPEERSVRNADLSGRAAGYRVFFRRAKADG